MIRPVPWFVVDAKDWNGQDAAMPGALKRQIDETRRALEDAKHYGRAQAIRERTAELKQLEERALNYEDDE